MINDGSEKFDNAQSYNQTLNRFMTKTITASPNDFMDLTNWRQTPLHSQQHCIEEYLRVQRSLPEKSAWVLVDGWKRRRRRSPERNDRRLRRHRDGRIYGVALQSERGAT